MAGLEVGIVPKVLEVHGLEIVCTGPDSFTIKIESVSGDPHAVTNFLGSLSEAVEFQDYEQH